jgi:hypothetical protein
MTVKSKAGHEMYVCIDKEKKSMASEPVKVAAGGEERGKVAPTVLLPASSRFSNNHSFL